MAHNYHQTRLIVRNAAPNNHSARFRTHSTLKVTLELEIDSHVHYTDIEKKACATCLSFATTNTVRKQFYHYLLENGYVERVNRGVYRITLKGDRLLEILS